jgi:hypothetical protein
LIAARNRVAPDVDDIELAARIVKGAAGKRIIVIVNLVRKPLRHEERKNRRKNE